jgi:hypothetical protein
VKPSVEKHQAIGAFQPVCRVGDGVEIHPIATQVAPPPQDRLKLIFDTSKS